MINIMYGWTGVVLRVNLTKGIVEKESINANFANTYIGQRGLAVKYYTEECDPSADALGPDNALVIMTGPMTGLYGTGTNRYELVTKSPLNGRLIGGGCGGHFGPELKFAGYDGIIIQGQSTKPVYLWIHDGTAKLSPADDIWGENVFDTSRWLKDRCGPRSQVCCIGLTSEKQSLLGCIMGDGLYTAGSDGIGAVMGAKRLKGIVVSGSGSVVSASPKEYFQIADEDRAALLDEPISTVLGSGETVVMMDIIENICDRPLDDYRCSVRNANWEVGNIANSNNCEIRRRHACFSCPIGCHRVVEIKRGLLAGILEGLEYEYSKAFSGCGELPLDVLLRAHEICKDYGMNPEDCGAVVSCTIRLAELGAVEEKEIGLGRPICMGDSEVILGLTRLAGKATAFGAKMAMGSDALAINYGHPELVQIDSNSHTKLGSCLISNCSRIGAPVFITDIEGNSPEEVERNMDKVAYMESCGICQFCTTSITLERACINLQAATGISFTSEDAYGIGRNIRELEKNFNLLAKAITGLKRGY